MASLKTGNPNVQANRWYIIFNDMFIRDLGQAIIGQAVPDPSSGRATLQNMYTVKVVNVTWEYLIHWGFTGRAKPLKNPTIQHTHAYAPRDEQKTYTVVQGMGKRGLRGGNFFKDENVWFEFPKWKTIPKRLSRPLI